MCRLYSRTSARIPKLTGTGSRTARVILKSICTLRPFVALFDTKCAEKEGGERLSTERACTAHAHAYRSSCCTVADRDMAVQQGGEVPRGACRTSGISRPSSHMSANKRLLTSLPSTTTPVRIRPAPCTPGCVCAYSLSVVLCCRHTKLTDPDACNLCWQLHGGRARSDNEHGARHQPDHRRPSSHPGFVHANDAYPDGSSGMLM